MTHSIINQDEKICCIEKLLQSKVFNNGSSFRKILEYYLENLQEGDLIDCSETSIALDALEKDLQFNPYYDSSIRVAMHRLRTALANYYSNEGKNDPVKMHIPLGDYNPFFYKNIKKNSSEKYCILILKAITFQIEYTLSEEIIELYNHVIENNVNCLSIDFNHSFSCSRAFSLLHYPLVLNRALPLAEKELKKMIDEVYRDKGREACTLLLKSYHCLYRKETMEAGDLAREAYSLSQNYHLSGISLLFQIFSGFYEKETLKNFFRIQDEYPQHPPYWLIGNISIALKNNNLRQASEYAQKFNSVPSKLSRTIFLAIKGKMKKLTAGEKEYIAENRNDFSRDFLSFFLSPVIDRLLE